MRVLVKGLIVILLTVGLGLSKETGFTQQDRERLIKLETTLRVFMEQVDKRFEQVDKRFEQVDKRFEQVNGELNRLVNIMVGIFAGQIALVVAVIGFAWWDRRTIVGKAREDTIDYLILCNSSTTLCSSWSLSIFFASSISSSKDFRIFF